MNDMLDRYSITAEHLHEDARMSAVDLQSKKMQVAGEKKKESQRDCKKSETVN